MSSTPSVAHFTPTTKRCFSMTDQSRPTSKATAHGMLKTKRSESRATEEQGAPAEWRTSGNAGAPAFHFIRM